MAAHDPRSPQRRAVPASKPCYSAPSTASLRLAALTLFLTVATPNACSQNAAQILLKRVSDSAAKTQSLSTHVLLSRRGPAGNILSVSGQATLLKPNFGRIQLTGDDPDVPLLSVSDGRDLYEFADASHYTQASIDSAGSNLRDPWWALPLRFFFVQSVNPFASQPDPTAVYTQLPDELHQGRHLRVLSIAGRQVMSYSARILIDSSDRIVATEVTFGSGPEATFFKAELTSLKTGLAFTPADFHFSPPSTAIRKQGSLADLMLPLGETAPDLRLSGLDSTPVTLSAQWHGAKATLVNFWFLNCPPCRIEFPEFQKLYTQLHMKGLNILAIDKADDPAAVTKFVHSAGFTFPVLLGGEPDANSVFTRYRVMDIFPATYLVDDKGRIVYRAAGVDLAGLRKALATLGVQ